MSGWWILPWNCHVIVSHYFILKIIHWQSFYFLVYLTWSVNKFRIWKFIPNSILYFIILLFISCGEKPEADIINTVQFEGKIYRLNEEDPFSGIVFNKYPDGQREYEGLYKNGKPNGNLVYWYENGSIKREGRLKNGSPIGKWTYYNSDGSIQKITNH